MYFRLFEVEGKIRNRYEIELAAVLSSSYDRIVVEREVYRAIGIRQAHEGWRYSVIEYFTVLDADLITLAAVMNETSMSYRDRLTWARQAYDSLTYIKNIVLTGMRYIEDLNQRERDRLSRERIELRKMEAESYNRQLEALEEQNRLRRQELLLEEQRLRELYLQNSSVDLKASITFTI